MHDWKAVSGKLGGLSRTTVFALWQSGEMPSVKIGKRRFSTDKQIRDYIEKLEAGAA